MVDIETYDDFSLDYDKFVNWESRLNFELPFLEAQVGMLGAYTNVLDAACGTGMHAIALAKKGINIAGADLSIGMVEKARNNASLEKLDIRFEQAGFGELSKTFGVGNYNGILCLGNSLPHVLSKDELSQALIDFAHCLKTGGIIVIQNLNFDRVMKNKERWMEPQSYQERENEWLFLRFYDYQTDGMIGFNILTLQRGKDRNWHQSVTRALLRPILRDEIVDVLMNTGFEEIQDYGDLTGSLFNISKSANLVITAKRQGGGDD